MYCNKNHLVLVLACLGILCVTTHADIISDLAQSLQSVAKHEKKDNFFATFLNEVKQLPQTPQKFPQTKSLTADVLLNTAQQFVDKMKDWLADYNWPHTVTKLEGGTEGYLFVRKLIVPQNSVIEFRGDLHGDVHSLVRWLDSLTKEGWFEKNNPFKLTQESLQKNRFLAFLGDYTDRGHYGAEIMYIIMQLFLHNPDNVLIVRGNHEDYQIISEYGFVTELKKKFSFNNTKILKFVDIYEYLPVALFLGCKNDLTGGVDFIQCCHGGMEFGYDSHALLKDENNHHADAYEWLDSEIDKKRGDIACLRHVDIKDLLAKCVCGKNKRCKQNGFQWNDFDFKNEAPLSLPDLMIGRGYVVHQKYTTRLLEDATPKKSKNRVLAVFRAHQHDGETVQHILDYGNGIYKLWNNDGSTKTIKEGYDWIKQWSGQKEQSVPLEKYSVWTFNVAPRTGVYEDRIARPQSFSYDTIARLNFASGFENWTLYPRKIPVL